MKLLMLVLGMVLASTLAAQTPKVETKLLADHSAIGRGEAFLVGVLFDIEDPWHIYWHYPGDAGMATSVRWTLPAGFEVSELMWPVPKRFTQEGDIEGFGYEQQVMLIAKVTPPAGYSGPADIKASLRWLACKDVCVPGRAEVATTLQIGATTPVPANAQTFKQWLSRVPMEGKQITAKRMGMSYELALTGAPEGADVQVFVAPPDGVSVQRVEQQGGTVRVEFAKMLGATVSGKAEVVMQAGPHAYRVMLSLD